MMGGVLMPTEGSVIIDGINMADDPERVKKRLASYRTGHSSMKSSRVWNS
jgi:ABC-type Na+ transport system ATPase subunit NatA